MQNQQLMQDAKTPPIVAIHGSASSGRLWSPLIQNQASDRVVIAPDLAGYGPTDPREVDLNATLQARAKPIIDDMLQLQQPIHLIAHSFGASVALEIAKTLPERVRSLIFYEPVVPALLRDSDQATDHELLGDLLALSEIVRGTSAKVGMETFVDFWSEANTWVNLSGSVQSNLAALAPIVYQDFIEAYHNAEPNFPEHIVYVGPISVLMGAQANNHTKRMAALLAQQFPQTTTETLDGMGHMGPLTDPDIVSSRIIAHIEKIESRSDPFHSRTTSLEHTATQ